MEQVTVQIVVLCASAPVTLSSSGNVQTAELGQPLMPIPMGIDSKLGMKVLAEEKQLSVKKLYRKQQWPDVGQNISSFDQAIQLGPLGALVRLQIIWPPELVSLPAKLKKRWAKGQKMLPHLAAKFAAMQCHPNFWFDLQELAVREFNITMICDDSGSMNTLTLRGNERISRWQELKDIVSVLLDLSVALDENGADLIFLNRHGKRKVTKAKRVEKLFLDPPVRTNTTPLHKALQKALAEKEQGKPLLIVIATDGVPDDMNAFVRAIQTRPLDVYISLVACSDKESEIGYLNELDEQDDRMDVLDDYFSERDQVQRIWGNLPYTYGDHIARILLGPVFPKYDKLDERHF